MISMTNAGKEYSPGRWGLVGVSFTMHKGEFVILTGPSGSGKTTLLKLLSFEERPTVGEVRLEGFSGASIRKRDLPRQRRRIGLVFQDFRLLRDRTVYENVAFVLWATGARKNGLHRRVLQALASVGLSSKSGAKPDELSGGEQQRVGIARAIVNDPFVILADEPTGNLDEETKREIFRLLKKVSQSGTAVLVATHDVSVAKELRARTLTLDRGKLVGDSIASPSGSAYQPSPLATHPMRARRAGAGA
jgi:cell division transport system ATP-binding protein